MTHKNVLIFISIVFTSTAFAAEIPKEGTYTNTIGMKLARIKPGSFTMGSDGSNLAEELLTKKSHFPKGDFDEYPSHKVRITKPFYMGIYEVTNAQYEKFDPGHAKRRDERGYSNGDNEAVIFVSWNDAVRFCKWLSDKEGLPYRLPTEAEWEYACRAGTKTAFHAGDTLGDEYQSELEAPLTVGDCPPNPWGLYDMHGNVEEWCHDFYGPYKSKTQTDPVGVADGDFKVTRGGSHWTEPYYLRSANRLGSHPDDRQWLIGFRVVLGQMPATKPSAAQAPKRYQQNINQQIPKNVNREPDPDKPYFKGPRIFVRIPEGSRGPLFDEHSHFASVTQCPNGDLLATWFTCMEEMGRELGIAISRLRYGHDQWQQASSFWDAPDRNDHTEALWNDGKGNVWHFNGLGVKYRQLALLLRKSSDNGATWSKAKIILDHNPELPNKIVESVFRASDGSIIFPMDGRGSMIAISRDEGLTWTDPGLRRAKPNSGSIRGTHAGVTQLSDGRLIAFGRHGAIERKMPISTSTDMGENWTYRPSPFPSIHSGRRVGVLTLKQGPLFVASFCRDMMIKDVSGNERPITGLFAAVSLDDGKTWPHVRLVSDDAPTHEIETMDGDPVIMDKSNSEPVGYLGACQSANGLIHLVSSRNHYAFNLKWATTLPPTAPASPPPPKAKTLPAKKQLANVCKPRDISSKSDWGWNLNAGRNSPTAEAEMMTVTPQNQLKVTTADRQFWLRTEKPQVFGRNNPKKGFTAEVRTQIIKCKPDQRGIDLELYDGNGSRYAITVTDTGVYWYQGLVQGSAFLPFGQYVPVAEGLDNTDAMHTYRLAVRKDRIVQIYRDEKLLAAKLYEYRTPRSAYIYFGAFTGVEAIVDYVAYDLNGPYQP
ncbi:MAG: SUMF1/EgtB/PvdO family nonheme iron enzyme [Planctomycetota bacterium]|jgi:formylglycine-generating enzyme required for sulfatase activity